MESPELLAEVLDGPAGTDCAIDPEGSPPGAVVRVLYTTPFLPQTEGTGTYANASPELMARRIDVAAVVPEQTVLRIEGRDYVAERSERVGGPGDHWRRLPLRNAPEV